MSNGVERNIYLDLQFNEAYNNYTNVCSICSKRRILMGKSEKEFIMDKCEEITTACHEYQELNIKILEEENDIRKMLGKEGLSSFIRYESLIIEQLTLAKYIIYIGASD